MSSIKIRKVAQNICANLPKLKTLSGRDVDYVSKEIHQAFLDSYLYHAANMMIDELSSKGKISPTSDYVNDVLDAMSIFDNGVYSDRKNKSEGGLLPCPFCGRKELKFKGEYHANYLSNVVECYCSAKVYGRSTIEVIDLWNGGRTDGRY